MTEDEIAGITRTLETLARRLDKNDADHVIIFEKVDEVMGSVREITATVSNWRVWRARVEGMVSGGRWTLILIGIAAGVAGTGGIEALINLK